MLRVLLAAVAGGIALQLWISAGAAFKPWQIDPPPAVPAIPPAAPAAPTASLPAGPEVQFIDTPVLDPPEDLPPLPDRTQGRGWSGELQLSDLWQNIVMSFGVGLVAALTASLLPTATPAWRGGLLMAGAGGLTLLVGLLSEATGQAALAENFAARAADQFCGVVILSTVVCLIVRGRLPQFIRDHAAALSANRAVSYSRTS
jgi:hypothetical protein